MAILVPCTADGRHCVRPRTCGSLDAVQSTSASFGPMHAVGEPVRRSERCALLPTAANSPHIPIQLRLRPANMSSKYTAAAVTAAATGQVGRQPVALLALLTSTQCMANPVPARYRKHGTRVALVPGRSAFLPNSGRKLAGALLIKHALAPTRPVPPRRVCNRPEHWTQADSSRSSR